MKLLNNVLRSRGRKPGLLPTITLALLMPLAVLATACGGGTSSGGSGDVTAPPSATSGDPLAPQPLAERQKITVGLDSPLEAFAPVLLGVHLGEFEKENLDVELKYMPTAESTLLVAQGKLDAGYGAYAAGMFNTIGQGSKLRFVFPGVGQPESSTQGFWVNNKVLGASGDLTADDFKGKKVLTVSGDGSPSAALFHDYVKSLPGGDTLAAKDLVFERFDPGTVAQALKSGAAAVAQVNSPHDQQLVNDDCCTFLEGAYPPDTVSMYYFGPSMSKRADAGAALIRALARTTHTYLAEGYRDDDKTMKALAEVMKQDIDILKKSEPLYWDPEFATNVETGLGLQKFFRERELLQYEEDLTPEDVYDTSYLEAIGVTP